MKIIVFSDSHSDVDTMIEVVNFEKPDMIFHLGDNTKDAALLSKNFKTIPIKNVIGNTDSKDDGSEEVYEKILGHKIILTHGHQQGVDQEQSGIKTLLKYCEDKGADILMFGHSHQPFALNCKGVWLFNPGRVGKKSSRKIYATYGILNLSDNNFEWKFVEA